MLLLFRRSLPLQSLRISAAPSRQRLLQVRKFPAKPCPWREISTSAGRRAGSAASGGGKGGGGSWSTMLGGYAIAAGIGALASLVLGGDSHHHTNEHGHTASSEKEHFKESKPEPITTATVAPAKKAFDEANTTVIFVLGGPGSGKGTQCAKLVQDYGYPCCPILPAGDLLRAERKREGSQYGELINEYIKEGLIVPMEITIALLESAMKASGAHKFLIDGFPRKMDQAWKFEEVLVESKLVLYFECPEEEMLQRLLQRGVTSGRVDDNLESIRKRFVTFRETSFPVIEYYRERGRVKTISCMGSAEDVHQRVTEALKEVL